MECPSVETREEGRISMTTARANLLAGSVPLNIAGNREFSKMNARTVEFIAKAGKEEELRKRFSGSVLEQLKRKGGFAGLFVLTSHKEPRRFLVLTFWKSADEAAANQWEKTTAILRQVSSLIDVCAKVHTYEATCAGLAEHGAMAIGESC